LLVKFKEIEIIKHLLLNNQQYLAIEFLKIDDDQTKILYNISSSLEQKEEKIEKVLDYFVSILLENPLSDKDEFIFNRLDKVLKEKILDRVRTFKNNK
jgi:hypothetical protein